MSILGSFLKKDSEALRKKREEKRNKIMKRNELRKNYKKQKLERKKLKHNRSRGKIENNSIHEDE
jgi:hypothetical protein